MAIFELFSGNIGIQQLIWEFMLPFLIIFAILWGVLSMLRIFSRQVNLVLSIALTLMVSASPLFTVFANYVSQFGAFTAILAFLAVFVFGAVMWAIGSGKRAYHATAGSAAKVKKLQKDLEKAEKELNEAIMSGDENRMNAAYKKKKIIEDELEKARAILVRGG